MNEPLRAVTRKGQVTIPVEIRRAMALKRGDKVAFVVERDGVVRLVRSQGVVARTKGLLKGPEGPVSAKRLRRMAEEAIAASVIERSGP